MRSGRQAAIAACLLLSGCGAAPVLREPVEVRVPVPVPCVVEIPPAPRLSTDAELAGLPDGHLVRQLARERYLRQAYAAELAAVLAACVAAGSDSRSTVSAPR